MEGERENQMRATLSCRCWGCGFGVGGVEGFSGSLMVDMQAAMQPWALQPGSLMQSRTLPRSGQACGACVPKAKHQGGFPTQPAESVVTLLPEPRNSC